MRAIRGSTGFSAGAGGMEGVGPNIAPGAVEVGKRGGEGVWDGLELTVLRMRDSSSKSGREELEADGVGGSKVEGGCTGGG